MDIISLHKFTQQKFCSQRRGVCTTTQCCSPQFFDAILLGDMNGFQAWKSSRSHAPTIVIGLSWSNSRKCPVLYGPVRTKNWMLDIYLYNVSEVLTLFSIHPVHNSFTHTIKNLTRWQFSRYFAAKVVYNLTPDTIVLSGHVCRT